MDEIIIDLDRLDWEKMGDLVPGIVQDWRTGRVLMLGFLNRTALEKTLETRQVTFWSRSRQTLWTKGDTSGHYLDLKEIKIDCDQDTLLLLAVPRGPVCHQGTFSCFAPDSEFIGPEFLAYLERLIENRRNQMPPSSYTTALFESGLKEIAKKVGEEAMEVLLTAWEKKQRSVEEMADLVYHALVFLVAREIKLSAVVEELNKRHFKNS